MKLHSCTRLLEGAALATLENEGAASLGPNLDAVLRATADDAEINNAGAVRQLVEALAKCFQPPASEAGSSADTKQHIAIRHVGCCRFCLGAGRRGYSRRDA